MTPDALLCTIFYLGGKVIQSELWIAATDCPIGTYRYIPGSVVGSWAVATYINGSDSHHYWAHIRELTLVPAAYKATVLLLT